MLRMAAALQVPKRGSLTQIKISDKNGCWIVHEYVLCLEHPYNKNNNIVLCRLRKNQNACGVVLQGNQEKSAKLKTSPAMQKGDHDNFEEKYDKCIENPCKRRELNNMREETEQRIDDAQFQLSDSELIETSMYLEPGQLMIDKETPNIQASLSMGSTWTENTATTWVLENAALETHEDLMLDDFSIVAPLNIDDLLSVLDISNDLDHVDDE
uniref:NAC domain-containing protein n=1 Tax=Rhizophora mucronata TaxID=61149 RepID=A0A2P2N2Z3_RHIMU